MNVDVNIYKLSDLYKNLSEDKIHRAIGFYLARVDPEEDSDKNE